VLPSTDLGSH